MQLVSPHTSSLDQAQFRRLEQLLIYILLLGVGATFYVALTRFRLPYLDYTVNGELELLEQVDPVRHRARLQEIYGKLNADRKDMEQRGYINSARRAQ